VDLRRAAPQSRGLRTTLTERTRPRALLQPPEAPTTLRAIEEVGYSVPEAWTEVAVADMICAPGVSRVERALARVGGVTGAAVNLTTGRVK
jgi:hypothetical protein